MDIGLIALTLFWFFLILSFLVFIHEFGHFLAAKLIGTHVEEFGLGYPPRVRKLFTKWHTVFTLNALPFGGFVRIWGDDAEQIEQIEPGEEGAIKKEQGINATHAGSSTIPKGSIPFSEQPQWKRLIVVLAGIAVNFVFGIAAFAGIYSFMGIPEKTGNVQIVALAENSPAAANGVQLGDEILALETNQYGKTVIQNAGEFTERIKLSRGEEVKLYLLRDGKEITLPLTPRTEAETPENQGALGVGLEPNVVFRFYPWYEMPFRGILVGFRDAFGLSKLIVSTLGSMVGKLVTQGQIPQDLSGPVGIVDQLVQAEAVRQGVVGTFNWAALLSINLAVMNLLPIPALDGGRAVFIILETFIGKARRLRWERLVNGYSFAFLIGLILLISVKDVLQIIL